MSQRVFHRVCVCVRCKAAFFMETHNFFEAQRKIQFHFSLNAAGKEMNAYAVASVPYLSTCLLWMWHILCFIAVQRNCEKLTLIFMLFTFNYVECDETMVVFCKVSGKKQPGAKEKVRVGFFACQFPFMRVMNFECCTRIALNIPVVSCECYQYWWRASHVYAWYLYSNVIHISYSMRYCFPLNPDWVVSLANHCFERTSTRDIKRQW